MPTRIEVDVTTGEIRKVELTQAEIDAAAAATAAATAAEIAAANTPEALRKATDEAERIAAKVDAQIIGDINRTDAEVNALVDQLFPTFTNPQKAFMRRLTRMAQFGARAKLRNGS